MANPIAIRDVRKTYGDFVALGSIDLDIEAGEFLTLLGPSGSGKTTLLMIMAGFIRPDRGSIKVAGREILRTPPHKRNIGMVFQNYALFPHMDVAGNVAFPLRLRKVGQAEADKRVREALRLVQLEQFIDRRVDQLSGGQRQRVALARAMVFEPEILLMDEPLSALDKKLREEMQVELKHLHQRLGMTTVYVTHDQREALTMSDRVAVMNHGALCQVAPPREIYEAPSDRFVADFIGESYFVALDAGGGGELALGGRPVRLSQPPRGEGARHYLVVRPEKLALLDGETGGHNVLEGKAEDVVFQGESVLIAVRLADGQRIAVRKSTGHGVLSGLPESGEAVRLGLHPEDSVVVRDA
ncbi:ABC transporter ATP-binding protein [Kaustia mangrovi]|uniref:Spermidine/putrescine import ATP-binding protein PotA n=1 Tax=Kaustia mangrovi TaxID=2593653 RepID=A0A7S8HBW4_9HYPH|nr:ABC transporter ATP-binding protein [Kaustia mangrovi]QPC42628.1 ABC transporter ATP-binding protein [Kaustia mangrovi]